MPRLVERFSFLRSNSERAELDIFLQPPELVPLVGALRGISDFQRLNDEHK